MSRASGRKAAAAVAMEAMKVVSTCKKMFKWKSETLTREDKTIVKDVDTQLLGYKRIMDKGVKRVWNKN